MANSNVKLSSVVTDALARATITDTQVVLPPGLDRPVYMAVNRALEIAGGKWSRKAQAHVFSTDPRAKLGLALDGVALVNEKQLYQAFYTPSNLAERIAVMADVAGCRVLEPSAGDGVLALACRQERASDVRCVEIRPEAATILRSRGFETYEGDFLTLPPDPQFERVVMNPPFTRGQDAKHITHALKFLCAGGVLTSIIPGGKREEQIEAMAGGHAWEMLDLGVGVFREAGTQIRTALLTIRIEG